MSAQFISRNPLFFLQEVGNRKKNHTSNKNKLVNFRLSMKKITRRIFMIKNFQLQQKRIYLLKKYLLNERAYSTCSAQDKGNILLKILNSPLPFFFQALPVSCTPSANIKINCKAFLSGDIKDVCFCTMQIFKMEAFLNSTK